MNRRPLILLFGLPRSGTTWLGKIFDSHPDTLYRHEPDSWGRLNGIPLVVPARDTHAHGEAARTFAEALAGMRETKVAGSLPVFPKRYYSTLGFRLHRSAVYAAKAGARLAGELRIPALTGLRRAERLFVVWKSIESVGRMGLLARVLPESRGILLVRHPCGFAASVLRGESQGRFTSTVPASEDYGILEWLLESAPARRRGLSLADFPSLTPEERLAWQWVLFNEKAMEDLDGQAGFEVIRYEDLCADPVGVTARMFSRTGLSMEPQTEAFLGASSSEDRGGFYGVYKASGQVAARWRRELSGEAVERIQEVARRSRPGELAGV